MKIIIVTAIISITLLEVIAISKGLNGTLLDIVIATIAGMAGLATPTEKIIKKIKEVMKK